MVWHLDGAPRSPGGVIGGFSFGFTLWKGMARRVRGVVRILFGFLPQRLSSCCRNDYLGESVASAFALAFAFSFALTARVVVVPPEGISASDFPVAGGEGSTG